MGQTVRADSPIYGLDFQTGYVTDCYGVDLQTLEVLKDNSGGGAAVADAVGGVVTLSSGGTPVDNDGIYLNSIGEVVKFDRDFVLKSKFKYSEAGANVANAVAIGCMNAAAVATILTANGGGPTPAKWAAMIYKVDGETVWRCATCNGTAVQTNKTLITAASTEFADFEIQCQVDPDGLYASVSFLINGEICLVAESNLNEPIKHDILIASCTEMNVFAGGQAGSAAEEVFSLDALGWATVR